jgi:hypothetical protein
MGRWENNIKVKTRTLLDVCIKLIMGGFVPSRGKGGEDTSSVDEWWFASQVIPAPWG